MGIILVTRDGIQVDTRIEEGDLCRKCGIGSYDSSDLIEIECAYCDAKVIIHCSYCFHGCCSDHIK